MVIGAFPAAKLGILAIRQVAKPIAEILKKRAKASKGFRTYVCMPPAQFYNWLEVKTKMWALNLGRPVSVPPLSEAQAIELGANLLGEFIIFTIGAGALIFEYNRQTTNEARKQEAQRLEKLELKNELTELGFRVERQDTQIREMTRALAELGHPIRIPDKPKPKSSQAKKSKSNQDNQTERRNIFARFFGLFRKKRHVEPEVEPQPENTGFFAWLAELFSGPKKQ